MPIVIDEWIHSSLSNLRERADGLIQTLHGLPPLVLARDVVITITLRLLALVVLSLLVGGVAWFKRHIPSMEVAEPFDHVRRLTLNVGVALLAVITASVVLINQQKEQERDRVSERLLLIDAILAAKLDTAIARFSRLYITQAALLNLNTQFFLSERWSEFREFGVMIWAIRDVLSKTRLPPIMPSELLTFTEPFRLPSRPCAPFIYASLWPESASDLAINELHLAVGFVALANDLSVIHERQPLDDLVMREFELSKLPSDDVRALYRLGRRI